MSEAAPGVSVDRSAIRNFLAGSRGLLEKAQLDGTLARTKLDVKDAAEQAFVDADYEKTRFFDVVTEELDALCADLRLASVTVQQQVERKPPKRWGLATVAAVITGIVTLFVMAGLFGDAPSDTTALLGFGIPIVVAVLVLIYVR